MKNILLFLIFYGVNFAYAQFHITNLSPARNALNVNRNATISVQLNGNIDATTLNFNNAKVYGSQTGFYTAGSWSGGGTSTISYTPSTYLYKAGETITVEFTTALKNTSAVAFTTTHQYRFKVKSEVAPLNYSCITTYGNIGNYPSDLTAVDANNDGYLDIVFVEYLGGKTNLIFNNGSGILGNKITISANSDMYAINPGDIDGDGDMDILAGSWGSSSLTSFKNLGSGSFSAKTNFGSTNNTKDIALGDIDGDGDLDLICQSSASNNVAIYRNNGSGSLTVIQNLFVLGAYGVNLEDLDGDGDLDLATINYYSNAVTTYTNDGTGNFVSAQNWNIGNYMIEMETGDFDADGDIDIVVSGASTTRMSIIRNQGNGTFSAVEHYPQSDYISDLKVEDFHGDGDLDIASIKSATKELMIFKNNGSGNFSTSVSFNIGSNTTGTLTTGDFDNDGDVDIATTNGADNSISVLFNRNPPSIDIKQASSTITHSSGIYDFGVVPKTTTKTITFTVENPSTSPENLLLQGFSINGANPTAFSSVNWLSSSVGSSGNTTFQLSFTPPTVGFYTAFITIANNSCDKNPYYFTIVGQGDPHTWTNGNATNVWNDANNWSPNSIPACTDDVIISGVTTVNINSPAQAKNISVKNGASLIIQQTLSVCGDVTNDATISTGVNGKLLFQGTIPQKIKGANPVLIESLEVNNGGNGLTLQTNLSIQKTLSLTNGNLISNGNLKLLSDATNTAMVINTNGTVTGNATQQRYVDGSYNAVGYRYFSSPVQSTNISSVFASKMSLICNTAFNAAAEPAYASPFPTFYFYDESKSGTSKGTIPYQYDEFMAGWQVPNSTDNMAVMKGYIANIAKGQTLDFTGVLNNGALNIALTKGSTGINRGWNLVGNPYPSPIDWSKVLALSSNVDDAIYQRIATGQYSGTWASFVNGVGTNGGTDRIALGQGFLLRCNNTAGGNLVMNNTVRVGTYVNPSSFRAEENQKQALVKIALKGNGLSDETAIYFQNGATPNFDQKFDAAKVQTNAGVTLYTKIGNDKISINALPILAESDSSVIPLIFYVPNNGNYSFDLSLNCLDQKSEIYLEDKQSNKLIDLRSNANYHFSAKVGTDENRFAIKFLAPLPEINDENIIVYPNPAELDIKVRFANNYEGKISIKIFDTEGREIKNKQTDSQKIGRNWEQVLNTSDLSHGLYFLQIQTEKALFSKKVVKQ